MAASSPALSNNSTDSPSATLRRDTPPKTLRGLNKPKCIQCGNVARSRGSGPAYIFLAIEALADGGAASLVAKSGKHPAQLKDDIASYAGTTTAGIHELEKSGFRGILMNAVVAAAKRSRELS